jgi:hypothetical protein
MDIYQGYFFPILRREHLVVDNTTSEDIEIGPVPGKKMWVITNLAAENETTNFTSLRVGVKIGSEIAWLMEDYSLLVDRLYWFAGQIFLPENAVLVVRFFGCTALDVLSVYANGFQVRQPEESHVPNQNA